MKTNFGYTLLEMLMAVAILSLVTAQFGGSLVACLRLYRVAIAEAELPLRARELREKLLFHVQSPADNMTYDGLLSAANPSVDTVAINYSGEQIPKETLPFERSTKQHRLRLDERFLINDGNQQDRSWLRPGGIPFSPEFTWNDFAEMQDAGTGNRIYLRLSLTATAINGDELGTRREAIILPLFNRYQKNTGSLPAFFAAETGAAR